MRTYVVMLLGLKLSLCNEQSCCCRSSLADREIKEDIHFIFSVIRHRLQLYRSVLVQLCLEALQSPSARRERGSGPVQPGV